MDDEEQDSGEEMLAFPEVFIKEEPHELQLQGLEDDSDDGRIGSDEDYGEEPDLGHMHEAEMAEEEEGAGLHDDDDDDFDPQEMEDMSGEDGEMLPVPKEGETRCGLCHREYSSAASLKAHLSKKHKLAMGPCFTCHLCGAIGQTRATLKRHLLRSHGQSSLNEHQMLRKCQHCGEGCVTQLSLNTHIAEAHADLLAQYHQCPHCPALFRTRHTMLRHISRRHPEAELPCLEQEKCQECQQTFPTRTALRLHLKSTHPEALIHRCSTCSATFKYSYMLRRHVKNIHEKEQQQKVQQPKEVRIYKCCKCPREYRCKTHLQKHLDTAHISPKEPQVYICAVCNASFATRSRRNRHTRMVHRDRSRPRCSECNQYFDSVEEFNIHRQTHRMKCAICEKTFLRRDTLREHLLIHNGPRHPCPHCPKKFTQSSNLKRHIRIHTGEKPYKCSFCNRRFGDKSACNSHMRVHTGAERCSCHLCGVSFSKRQKLNYHMRKHTGEGLLHCPLCTSHATNSYSLKKHLESHQAVLVGLLQGTDVVGKALESQGLALRTLHNLSWVTVRAKNSNLVASQHLAKFTPLLTDGKMNGSEGESVQVPASDCEKEKKDDVEDSEEVMTALGNVEVIVKVEPEEVDEAELPPAETGGRRSSLRQFRKVTRKINIFTDPFEMKVLELDKMAQEVDVKPDVLSCTINLRCVQFNEAVEKLKLESVSEEEKKNRSTNDALKKDEGETDETKDVPASEEMPATESDLSMNISMKEEDADIEIPADVSSEQMDDCSSALMEEPLALLSRLWQHIIEPKEGQPACQTTAEALRRHLDEQGFPPDSDNHTSGSLLDLGMESEAEEKENLACTEGRSSEVEAGSETSEAEEKETDAYNEEKSSDIEEASETSEPEEKETDAYNEENSSEEEPSDSETSDSEYEPS